MTTKQAKDNCIKETYQVPEQESHEEDESRNQKNVNGLKSVSCKGRDLIKNLNRKS